MKKQILVLAFFVLATFASVNMSYGQTAITHSAPLPLSCENDALHPIAGKPYTYTVAATPAGGTYTYWATKDPVFYTAGTYAANLLARLKVIPGQLSNISADYGTPAASDKVEITWSTDILAKTKFQATPNVAPTLLAPSPTFVAVAYTPPAGAGNCADNFKVFEIDPKNGFTVDILNLDPVTKAPDASLYTFTAAQCFANVSSAIYNAGKMDYLYGVNTLYYEVVAANFTESWTPTFKLTGLDAKQTAVIEWDYENTFPNPIAVTSGTPSPSPVLTSVTNTSVGVSIYVRVTVTNNSFEGLADEPLTLAVDGTNVSGQLDVVNTTCVAPALADFVDVAVQNLNKRPTVVEGTSSALLPSTSNGIIPKNP